MYYQLTMRRSNNATHFPEMYTYKQQLLMLPQLTTLFDKSGELEETLDLFYYVKIFE